jgi:predicted ATP-dependent protease
VVFEENPTYQNLVGEVEYLAQQGALVTDFGLIRGGALHRANGGYLVLDAHKVLVQPFAWQGLKQALEVGQVRIEPMGQAYSLVRTVTLEPEPVPLDVKVILIGERWIYYWLLEADPDFAELFKVAADFDDRMLRTPANDRLFAQLLGTLARQEGLQPVDRGGIARLIEESSRHAEHSGRLSAQVRRAADIMREASHWATRRGAAIVEARDVQHAVDRRNYRESRLRARLQEEILEGAILIDTEGERVGQVNGLAVI